MTPASTLSGILFLLSAGLTQAQTGQTDATPHSGHGMDVFPRDELALQEATVEPWPVEVWNGMVSARLEVVADAWSSGEIGSLDALPWIDPSLKAAPLFPADTEELPAPEGWRVTRGQPGDEVLGAGAPGLARALDAWRARFEGVSRLELEVMDVRAQGQGLVTTVGVQASGRRGGTRLQQAARWTCGWRQEEGGLVLLSLRVDSFEAVSLLDPDRGLFEDASTALFGAQGPLAEQLAPGLEHWRATLPAELEPGFLGHQGLAVGDVNGDGLEDLYLCQPGGLPNKLLLHLPSGATQDISAAAGVDILDYCSSALLLDLDEDGDLDLAVSTATGLALFCNDGAARFEQRGLVELSTPTSLAAADPDEDGDLDLYICAYISPYDDQGLPLPYHDANNGEGNVFLRNDRDWTFVDVTAEVGLDVGNRRFSFAAAWEDYDDDGDVDLYVANDFGRNNLYRNEGGHFTDVASSMGSEDVAAGMGVTWGDVDGDGRMDLYVTNMHSPSGARLTAAEGFREGSPAKTVEAYRQHCSGNTLLLNRGEAGFEDISAPSGTAMGRWGWGGLFLDMDTDGRLDLFSPNGFVTGARREDLRSYFWRHVVLQSPDGFDGPAQTYRRGWSGIGRLVRQGYSWNGNERNVAFLNLGGGRFADVSSVVGLDHADDGRAAARVDWDGDGDQDLIVTSRTGPRVRFLANRGEPGEGWIAFRLRGTRCNRAAVGARVTVTTAAGRRLVRSMRCGEGFLAQSSADVHFGLGEDRIEAVQVRWPGGEVEAFGAPARGGRYGLEQGSGRAVALPAPDSPPPLVGTALEVPGPDRATRTVLAARLPMPRLALEARTGQPAPFLGIDERGPGGTGQPLLLILWSHGCASCLSDLGALAAESERLSVAGIQVLALCVDYSEDRASALVQLEGIGWPFSRGFATEEAAGVIEVFQRALHDTQRELVLPTALLIDPEGWLIAMYRGQLDPEGLVADLALIGLSPQARRAAAAPHAGRWLAPLPQADLRGYEARFAARGLEHAAAEYHLAGMEVSTISPASFHHEAGLVRQEQGRLDLAIRHYQQALESDPSYFPAVLSLAVVYHQQQRYDLALPAYGEAVRLEPTHALTRFNLGLLYLALNDREGVAVQLKALRALKSEYAATLERRARK